VVGSCEVDNEPSGWREAVEIFYRDFAAPEGLYSNELDAIYKLILLSDFWGLHGSKYQYYIIVG